MDATAMIADVQVTGGLDVTSAGALALLNAVYLPAVAAAKYRMAELSFGSTVSGTATSVVDDMVVVDVTEVMVGSSPYEKVTTTRLWRLRSGALQANPSGQGYFAPDFSSSGATLLALFPTPSTSGDAITGLAAIEPTPLDTGANATPVIPPDLHPKLVDGGIALGKARLNSDPAARADYDTIVKDLGESLRSRRVSQLGSGSVAMAVRGYHFDG